MDWVSRLQERVKRRLVAKTYIDLVIDYISHKFDIPRDRVSIAFEPAIAGKVVPDAVVVYNGIWFIVEFKTRPNPLRDLEHVMRYKLVVDEHVRPKRSIPILAYVYSAPEPRIQAIAGKLKPLVVLHLISGTYRVLYESL